MNEMIKKEKIIQSGIYYIDNETYHSGPGVSNSGLTEFLQTPRHYYDRYLNPNRIKKTPSDDMILGSALHTKILEPHLFHDQFVSQPKINRMTKIGKAEYKNFLEDNIGKLILSPAVVIRLEAMLKSFQQNETAMKIVETGQVEKSFFWFDEETQVMCKTRPDIINTEYMSDCPFIADIKTTNSIIENDFKRTICDRGYHRQAAMAIDGVNKILGHNIELFLNICVQNTPPYYIAIYHQCDKTTEQGRVEYKGALPRFKACLETDCWPLYDDIQTITIPKYAFY